VQDASSAASGKPQDLPPPVPAAADPYVFHDGDDTDDDSLDDAWGEGVEPTYTQVSLEGWGESALAARSLV
jgi:hypothetical protein